MNEPDLKTMLVGALAIALTASAASACPGVGVIIRIEGKPQDVVIMRSEGGGPRAAIARPRVLEVLCQGDTVRADHGTAVTLSLDGSPTVKVQGAQVYAVGARRGTASLAGNAYRNVSDHLLPDMKRQPWDLRLRGPGRELGFALSDLPSQHQTLSAGARSLLVRLDGGVGAYKVQVVGPSGAVLAEAGAGSANVMLPRVDFGPGDYVIKAFDSSGANVEAHVMVVGERPPVSPDFSGMDDREVQAAATAADLAREHDDTWSLEAEQILASAPANGLDRESVYELIESYGPA